MAFQKNSNSTINKAIFGIFYILVFLSLLAPFLVFKELLFPFVTSKAFYFRIVIELALPFYLYLLIVNKEARPNFKNPFTILIAAFWVINLFSSLFGVNVQRSLWGNFERMGGTFYLLHLTLLYFYLLFIAQKSGRVFLFYLKLLIIISSTIAFYSMFTIWGMKPIIMDPSLPARASAFFGNPIYLGSFMVLPISLSLWFSFRAQNIWIKAVYFTCALFQVLALYFSGTRGSALGLALGILFAGLAFVWLYKGKYKVFFLTAGIIGIAVIAGLFVLATRAPSSNPYIRPFNLNDSNAQSRLLQWKVALTGFKDYPILGTGAENYYVVANKYYNPEIAKYDKSWFDKPHNYILEILLTNGILGLSVFLGLIVFSILALFKAFRAGFLSLIEFCALLGGFLAYQFQNLFVFENVSSSLLYFSVLSLNAYLWMESRPKVQEKKVSYSRSGILAPSLLAVSVLVSAYTIYATNIVPMRISKSVNYGFAYAAVDSQKALRYFGTAVSLPFNFDPGETGSRYAGFVLNWAQTYKPTDSPQDITKGINEAESILREAIKYQGNYPSFMLQLSNTLLVKDYLQGQRLDPDAVLYAQKAVDLAPNRTEARQYLIQIRQMQGDLADALALSNVNMELYPDKGQIIWQTAILSQANGKSDEAVKLAERAILKKYQPQNENDIKWIVDAYNKKGEYSKSVVLYENLGNGGSLDAKGFLNLGKTYLLAGEREKALAVFDALQKSNPELKSEIDLLIR